MFAVQGSAAFLLDRNQLAPAGLDALLGRLSHPDDQHAHVRLQQERLDRPQGTHGHHGLGHG